MEYTAKITFSCSDRETAEYLFTLMREAFCNWEMDKGVKEVSAYLFRGPDVPQNLAQQPQPSTQV